MNILNKPDNQIEEVEDIYVKEDFESKSTPKIDRSKPQVVIHQQVDPTVATPSSNILKLKLVSRP